MKRIVLLLQALTCLVVITVNGIVLYQFLNRSGCTVSTFDFTNSARLRKDALGFGDCLRRAVNQKDLPKKEIPVVNPSPSSASSPQELRSPSPPIQEIQDKKPEPTPST
ncbi:MAG TPA: hypothetical protein V6D50_15120 [Chroococcales cyanobacterium]